MLNENECELWKRGIEKYYLTDVKSLQSQCAWMSDHCEGTCHVPI